MLTALWAQFFNFFWNLHEKSLISEGKKRDFFKNVTVESMFLKLFKLSTIFLSMHDEIMNSKARKHLFNQIKEQWDTELDKLKEYVFIRKTSGKIFIVNKDVAELEHDLSLRIYSMGNYFGTETPQGFRLSIEGSQLLGPISHQNIISLNKEQVQEWINGAELELDVKAQGYCIVKYETDFVGCGKYSGSKLLNYVPKSRRIKNIAAIHI
jgi:NOL1/NOP2/fmu family ribosome biogenesis protein